MKTGDVLLIGGLAAGAYFLFKNQGQTQQQSGDGGGIIAMPSTDLSWLGGLLSGLSGGNGVLDMGSFMADAQAEGQALLDAAKGQGSGLLDAAKGQSSGLLADAKAAGQALLDAAKGQGSGLLADAQAAAQAMLDAAKAARDKMMADAAEVLLTKGGTGASGGAPQRNVATMSKASEWLLNTFGYDVTTGNRIVNGQVVNKPDSLDFTGTPIGWIADWFEDRRVTQTANSKSPKIAPEKAIAVSSAYPSPGVESSTPQVFKINNNGVESDKVTISKYAPVIATEMTPGVRLPAGYRSYISGGKYYQVPV